MNSRKIFLSYSMDDRPFVYSALKRLPASEGLHTVEIDDPADWGAKTEDVRKTIGDKIRRADMVWLVWSDQAAKSPWVQYEVGMAQALGVPIRVLLASGSQPTLPAGLADKDVLTID
ncbi:MAG: toll/interleukin-1 receptor domain-containing protein [Acidobacteriaceae bacterium]|nr:toll/interleukin-1 receptor domain-containing protein [Acidobacteriaceae bacterium]MBV9296847.1 toll/interleukin-1 receptor domain-containing protein [Acidobacteriaceae bacterium]MBV9763659.1 toll/interleukin-1 receptor domain-containing protein [Acidobacteriaceae bacterium]